MLDKLLLLTGAKSVSSGWQSLGLDADEKEALAYALKHPPLVVQLLLRRIREDYKASCAKAFDPSAPNYKDQMVFEAGYQKALIDLHKLFMTQGE